MWNFIQFPWLKLSYFNQVMETLQQQTTYQMRIQAQISNIGSSSECYFCRSSSDRLGHIINPLELSSKPNFPDNLSKWIYSYKYNLNNKTFWKFLFFLKWLLFFIYYFVRMKFNSTIIILFFECHVVTKVGCHHYFSLFIYCLPEKFYWLLLSSHYMS